MFAPRVGGRVPSVVGKSFLLIVRFTKSREIRAVVCRSGNVNDVAMKKCRRAAQSRWQKPSTNRMIRVMKNELGLLFDLICIVVGFLVMRPRRCWWLFFTHRS